MPIGDEPIVIATGNPHKVDEIRAVMDGIGVRVVGLGDLPGEFEEPVEGRDSFEFNATLKAVSYARQTGRVCLADDSGLEVDALGGAPGVISSHYATDGEETGITREQRDRANNAKLLKDLAGVPPEKRTARFVCTMVLAAPPLGGVFPPSPPGGGGFQPPHPTRSTRHYDGRFLQRTSGNLPHWDLGGATFFVTFNLRPGGKFSDAEKQIVLDACTHWHASKIQLHAACVMPDHVHLLFRTLGGDDGSFTTLGELMHSIKSYSATQINKLRKSRGPLWQEEYFDRIVRTPDEADETLRYIEANAMRAGIVERARDYPYLWESGEGAGGLEAPPSGKTRTDARVLAIVRGAFEGRIGMPGDVPRGDNGFGYDPLVLVAPEHDRTGAELDSAEKNARSHRGAAARLMACEIERLRVGPSNASE